MATNEEVQALRNEVERLRYENEEFKKRQRPVTFSVNDKGGISVYGVGKYPVSLYKIQWERILEKSNELHAFINENAEHLN